MSVVLCLPLFMCVIGNGSDMNFPQADNTRTVLVYKGDVLVPEKIESESSLHFFYHNKFGQLLRRLCFNRLVCKLNAAIQNSRWSKRRISDFVEKHDIKMDDFIIPEGGYASFNDFFIRKLKPGARSIHQDPSSIISPADSKVLAIPKISPTTTFFVKGVAFNLAKFLCDEKLAEKYEGGVLLLFRLAPYDYHHFHFPCDSVSEKSIIINGRLESVNPIAYSAGVQPLHENERHLCLLQTQQFGAVAAVPVGAMMVGKIIETYSAGTPYAKGDEMGYFSFGGSSLVLLFEPNKITIDQTLLRHSQEGFETVVTMGQAVAFLKTN